MIEEANTVYVISNGQALSRIRHVRQNAELHSAIQPAKLGTNCKEDAAKEARLH